MPGKTKKDKIARPAILYESKDLKIFANIDAAREAEIASAASQEPLDRIRETVQLILRVFPLKKKKSGNNKICIDKS